MRSITTRLILAFLLVGISGSILITLIIWRSTRNAFDRFILRREQLILVNRLLLYYQQNGSWQGVERLIESAVNNPPLIPGEETDPRRVWGNLTLVDSRQIVVYSVLPNQIGRRVDRNRLDNAILLTLNDEPVGWLMVGQLLRTIQPDSPESRFLTTVRSASVISIIIAVILALVLGSALTLTLTRSLRELTEATQDIARGQYGRQVPVRSQDELGRLALSFNQMSRQLERAVQARRQMTADIAHDLRSPLSVIQGYTEALSDGKLEGSAEIFNILHQETLHLNRLIDDLRLLSLADAGELPLYLQSIAPSQLLERAFARHSLSAQQKGVELHLEIEENLPNIKVDVERMAQVLDNLVINSLRYTPSGGVITLRARREQQRILLQVCDNGEGISPEDLPHIFDRFYRGDRSRQSSGESGLGLAIAKSLIESQGGSITVESEPGKGSVFTISLPQM
ncbi:MAG: sensor histidine kinase [Chloroflexota bacterium]